MFGSFFSLLQLKPATNKKGIFLFLSLRQWLSDFGMNQNQLENLLDRSLCLTLRVSRSVGPVRFENLMSKFFGVAAVSLGPHLVNQISTAPHFLLFYFESISFSVKYSLVKYFNSTFLIYDL